jgi:hypothetical protein
VIDANFSMCLFVIFINLVCLSASCKNIQRDATTADTSIWSHLQNESLQLGVALLPRHRPASMPLYKWYRWSERFKTRIRTGHMWTVRSQPATNNPSTPLYTHFVLKLNFFGDFFSRCQSTRGTMLLLVVWPVLSTCKINIYCKTLNIRT